MNKNRRWFPITEPQCHEPHPVVGYLCGFNRGHDGDHREGICLNSWPNTEVVDVPVTCGDGVWLH